MSERLARDMNIAKLVVKSVLVSGAVDGGGELEVIVARLASFDLLCFLLLGDMVKMGHEKLAKTRYSS